MNIKTLLCKGLELVEMQQMVSREDQREETLLKSDISFFASFTEAIEAGDSHADKDDQLYSDLQALLRQIIEKTGAYDGYLGYDHLGSYRVISRGEKKPSLNLYKNDQHLLMMGKPLQKEHEYIHPIMNDECLCGIICLFHDSASWKPLSRDLVHAYALLAAQNIEMRNTRHNLTQYANSLLEKKNELEKIQQYNQNLLSITTHDLSSPLNAVSGYLDMINEYLDEKENTNKMKGYYQRIQSGINDVSEMLGQLGEVIKHKKGFLTLNTVKVDAKWLVREVCEVLTANARKKGVDLQVFIPEKSVFIDVDVVKFKRVIYNLVSNAIKYTNKSKHVLVELTSTEEQLKLHVRDEGIGISDEKQDAIFEPFVKVNGAHKDDGAFSKGLGLYISSYFVELMKGEIKVQSKTGEGTVFTVTMPLVADRSA